MREFISGCFIQSEVSEIYNKVEPWNTDYYFLRDITIVNERKIN